MVNFWLWWALEWQRVKACFWEKWWAAHGYWTVYFARVQVFLGILLEVLLRTDIAPLVPDSRLMALWLIFSGVLTEYLRKRRGDV